MNTIRVGVIGVGKMGERHCRVYANLPRVELVGISDVDRARGVNVAESYGTAYVADYVDLLEQVDAVTVAVPTAAHYAVASKCLERGRHVLVEKPIAETPVQARDLVELADRKGRVLQVGHIERFNPAYIELKNVVDGLKLVSVNVRRLSPFDTSNTDVDVVKDLMIHDLDLMLDFLGEDVEEVHAWGRTVSTGGIDHAVAGLSFRGGPIVTLSASRVTEQKVRHIEVIAEGAYIEVDLLNKRVMMHRRTFPQYLNDHHVTKYRQESVIEQIHVPMIEPLMLQLRHFCDCVGEGLPCDVPGRDGMRALQMAERVTAAVLARDLTDGGERARARVVVT